MPEEIPSPPLECDLVMKGGIASGVIYPGLVCELAGTYRLRSVGGSSAGMIAAALAAAAETGRSTGGFERLAALPRELGADDGTGRPLLQRLFQPTAATAPLFRVLTAGTGGGGGKAARTLAAALRAFWTTALGLALPGLGTLAVAVLVPASGTARAVTAVAGVLLAVLGAAAGIAVGVLRVLGGALPGEKFGLCSGMPPDGRRREPALTPWLHERLESIAGRGPGGGPLTFGALTDAGVELRAMTTNLTRHQPLALPWDAREYWFHPGEMRDLFPEDVVAWLEAHPPDLPRGAAEAREVQLQRALALPLRPLPVGRDLPVLVATRMSLSFPLLLAAVPLHAVDFGAPVNVAAARAAREWLVAHPDAPVGSATGVPRPRFDVHWFSDGGICSNLPLHFFDSPLPRRPTFAIDLAPFPEGRAKSSDETQNSHLLTSNRGGFRRRSYPQPATGLGAVGAFLASIVQTARGWVDEAQVVMPGYRDRIVTIYHDDTEGGMNLAMPAAVIEALGRRGAGGGARLVARFAGSAPGEEPAPGWDNHRWIRYRTATAGLEEWLADLRSGYAADAPGTTPYRDLVGPGAVVPPPSYAVPADLRAEVEARTAALLRLADDWSTGPGPVFRAGAPTPPPRVRLVPDDRTASDARPARDGVTPDRAAVPGARPPG